MKKLLTAFFLMVGVCACDDRVVDIRGAQYELMNTPADGKITLTFSDTDNRYFGKAVNNYFGTYEIKGDKLILSAPASTMMMGPEDLMQAETQYFQDLHAVDSFHAKGNELIIKLTNGNRLIFKKKENAPVEFDD